MKIAEQIYETVKFMPENAACEVLDFAKALKNKQADELKKCKENALATLSKYRGRLEAENFNREELYDR